MNETEEQFEQRLCKVIAQAEITFFKEDYIWKPFTENSGPDTTALACVKDGQSWYQFVKARSDQDQERFRVVLFRFSEKGPSAIGFVAWLHSHLRTMGKTGAIVICGKDHRNSRELFQICQGAMDYWACPVGPASDRFINVIRILVERGKSE